MSPRRNSGRRATIPPHVRSPPFSCSSSSSSWSLLTSPSPAWHWVAKCEEFDIYILGGNHISSIFLLQHQESTFGLEFLLSPPFPAFIQKSPELLNSTPKSVQETASLRIPELLNSDAKSVWQTVSLRFLKVLANVRKDSWHSGMEIDHNLSFQQVLCRQTRKVLSLFLQAYAMVVSLDSFNFILMPHYA